MQALGVSGVENQGYVYMLEFSIQGVGSGFNVRPAGCESGVWGVTENDHGT